jgi:hypothetical protein
VFLRAQQKFFPTFNKTEQHQSGLKLNHQLGGGVKKKIRACYQSLESTSGMSVPC